MFKRKISSVLLIACIALLGACDKAEQPPTPQPAPQHTRISLSTEILPDDVDDSAAEALKSLRFDLITNPNGYAHPKIKLQQVDAQSLNARLLLRNTATNARFWATDANFQFNAKSNLFEIKDFDLSNAPADMQSNHPDKWQVLCVVGGRQEGDKIHFGPATNAIPVEAGSNVELPAIYMSKQWQDLQYKWDSKAQRGTLSLKGEGAKIELKNRCMILMCRISPNKLGREIKVQGFRISTSGLSFGGYFDMNTQGDALPQYTATARSNGSRFNATTVESVANNAHSKHYAWIAVPTAAQSNIRIYPLIGEDANSAVETMYSDFKNKTVQGGTYVGINNLISAPKVLEHPIEAFYMENPSSNEITRVGNGSASNINSNRGHVVSNGHYRSYSVPTVYQMAVLLPGLKGGVSKSLFGGNLSRAIIDFKLGQYHDTTRTDDRGSDTKTIEKEKVFVWGNGNSYTEFDAVYEHRGQHKQDVRHFGNTFYGIRFKGHGNKYLSAYKFVRKADNSVEVTVRTLGPSRANINIATVKNDAFWNAPLEWDQRQWVRTIKQGIYWSSTTATRKKATVYQMMKVFPTQDIDGTVAQPNGVFTTTDSPENRKTLLDSPSSAKNQGNYYVLFSTDQNGRPLN